MQTHLGKVTVRFGSSIDKTETETYTQNQYHNKNRRFSFYLNHNQNHRLPVQFGWSIFLIALSILNSDYANYCHPMSPGAQERERERE